MGETFMVPGTFRGRGSSAEARNLTLLRNRTSLPKNENKNKRGKQAQVAASYPEFTEMPGVTFRQRGAASESAARLPRPTSLPRLRQRYNDGGNLSGSSGKTGPTGFPW